MKYISILVLTLFVASFVSATENPVVAATNFYAALKANNIGEARKLIVNPDNLPHDGSTSFDVQNYYFFKWKVDNGVATVKTSIANKKGILTFNTILADKNGKWKVDFNKTMSNMMRSAIQKKQVSGNVELEIHSK